MRQVDEETCRKLGERHQHTPGLWMFVSSVCGVKSITETETIHEGDITDDEVRELVSEAQSQLEEDIREEIFADEFDFDAQQDWANTQRTQAQLAAEIRGNLGAEDPRSSAGPIQIECNYADKEKQEECFDRHRHG